MKLKQKVLPHILIDIQAGNITFFIWFFFSEKKWIAFQLLLALQQAHKHGVCHGDIKMENVMISSWNWVILTDFASFKPTYLPEDNPAEFSYFFDTSR